MSAKPIRSRFQSVVPYLTVQGAKRLGAFLTSALGGVITFESATHIEVRIGDSMLMIGDVGQGTPVLAQLFMYVDDAEACSARALAAGATAFMPPMDRPWGEPPPGSHEGAMMHGAGIKDPAGNTWFFASPK